MASAYVFPVFVKSHVKLNWNFAVRTESDIINLELRGKHFFSSRERDSWNTIPLYK